MVGDGGGKRNEVSVGSGQQFEVPTVRNLPFPRPFALRTWSVMAVSGGGESRFALEGLCLSGS